MNDFQSWLMVIFGFVGSGAALLLWRVGRQIVSAIRDVPQIVPLHEAAMAAIGEVKDEVIAVGVKAEGAMKAIAEVDTRLETVERHITKGNP